MPAVNGVGEPCAGEPHARFEVAGAGNGADLTKGTGVAQPPGKPAEHEGPRPYRQRATAPAPDPTHAYLREDEGRALLAAAHHDLEADAGQAERVKDRAQAAPASARPRAGALAGKRGARALAYYAVPGNSKAVGAFRPRRAALAAGATAPQPAHRLNWERMNRLATGGCRLPASCIPSPACASTPVPEAGAQCGSSARWDLCGGPPARAVPTGIGGLQGLLLRVPAGAFPA